MSSLGGNDRLSWGDALFLYMERDGMPMHVASVFIFEGHIDREDCIAFIEAKLPLIPRYRQRLATPPLNVGFPTWELDPEFDLRNHVHETALKRGTEAELKQFAGKILSVPLDRRHPLWDFTIVHGLKGDRTAVVARIHHCAADGIAGIGMMNVLMDPTPVPFVRPAKKRKKKETVVAPPPRDPGMLLIDGLIGAYGTIVQRALTAQGTLLNIGMQMVAGGGNATTELLQKVPELASPAEPLPFNVVCQGPQKFAWAQIPLAEIKAVKNAWEVTVNDVALAAVSWAVQRYSELHDTDVTGRTLRMMVPVNLRSDGDGNLGNNISVVPVTVPLDIRDARELVTTVHEKTEFLKKAHVAEFVSLAATLIGTVPAPLQAALIPLATHLPLAIWNMVCTNVRGPEMPLYLFGHKMLKWYPYVPIGGDMAVNCAILTYDGTAYFGFSGNVHAAPDLWRLEKFLAESFAALRKAASNPSADRQRRTKRARIATPGRAATDRAVATSKGSPRGRIAAPASQPAQEMFEDTTKVLVSEAVA